MPEKTLDVADVEAGFEIIGGCCVAEHVRGDSLLVSAAISKCTKCTSLEMRQNRNGQILYSVGPVEIMYRVLADGAWFWFTFKLLKLANFYAAVDMLDACALGRAP